MADFAKLRMFNMTLFTNRNNIKPMFGFIAVPMVILLGELWAVMTFEIVYWSNFAIFNSIAYSSSRWIFFTFHITFLFCMIFICLAMSFENCLNSKWASFTKLLTCFTACFFTFFCLLSSFSYAYIITMLMLVATLFAMITVAIFSCWMFRKLRERFCLFANSAGFSYDCFRHFCFSCKQQCLEPVAAHTVVGSTYYIAKGVSVNS